LRRPWQNRGCQKGRFGTPQGDPPADTGPPGVHMYVRTAQPYKLAFSLFTHAIPSVERVVERISQNDPGIDGFRGPGAAADTPKSDPWEGPLLGRAFLADDVSWQFFSSKKHYRCLLAYSTNSEDTAEANRSCRRPTVDGFRPTDSKTDDAKNDHPKHTQNGPQKGPFSDPKNASGRTNHHQRRVPRI
jgi:hypothetical protein